MFFLLIKIRLLSARNVALDTMRRKPTLAAGLTVLGIGLFTTMYIGFLLLFRFAAALHVLPETVYQVFHPLLLFLLAGAVPFVASTLLQSADYTLLFASPTRPSVVVAAKLLDATVANSLQFSILGVPAIAACAVATGLPLFAWPLVPFLIALFVLIPALLTALGLLVALAIVGIRRVRGAITLLNIVMAMLVCLAVVVQSRHLPFQANGLQGSMATVPADVAVSSPAAHQPPSSWFADALLAAASGTVAGDRAALRAIGDICALAALLTAFCILLGSRALSAANMAEESGVGTMRRSSQRERRSATGIMPVPIAAIVRKDLKYVLRDHTLVSQLAMPLILYVVPFLLRTQWRQEAASESMCYLSAMMIATILFMHASILSLSSVGLESQAFWMFLASPNSGTRLVAAKFLMSFLVSAGVAVSLTLASAAAFSQPWEAALSQVLVFATLAAGLCGLGAGIAAAFPRFVYENPAHRVSAWALILGFFGATGYILISALLLVTAWWAAAFVDNASQAMLVRAAGGALFLLITLLAGGIPLSIGARRIQSYSWEH